MATLNQKIRWTKNIYYLKWKRPKLNKVSEKKGWGSPQRKGTVIRLRLCTPRKPNSARRPVVKARLTTKKKVLSHIPGIGHNLRRHSRVLVCGVGARDLPVVNYTCLRGVHDFSPLFTKRRRRSIYAVKQLPELRTHVRRKFRNIER